MTSDCDKIPQFLATCVSAIVTTNSYLCCYIATTAVLSYGKLVAQQKELSNFQQYCNINHSQILAASY